MKELRTPKHLFNAFIRMSSYAEIEQMSRKTSQIGIVPHQDIGDREEDIKGL